VVATGIDIVPDSAVNGAASTLANITALNASVPVAEIAIQKILSAVCSRR